VQGFRPAEHRFQLAKSALRYAVEHPPERLQYSLLQGIASPTVASLLPAVLAVVKLTPTLSKRKFALFSQIVFLILNAVSKLTWHPKAIVAA